MLSDYQALGPKIKICACGRYYREREEPCHVVCAECGDLVRVDYIGGEISIGPLCLGCWMEYCEEADK
jgi:hypothetical protein